MAVFVAVTVTVGVSVLVGVIVAVDVEVLVGVTVAVAVGVSVTVDVAVWVAVSAAVEVGVVVAEFVGVEVKAVVAVLVGVPVGVEVAEEVKVEVTPGVEVEVAVGLDPGLLGLLFPGQAKCSAVRTPQEIIAAALINGCFTNASPKKVKDQNDPRNESSKLWNAGVDMKSERGIPEAAGNGTKIPAGLGQIKEKVFPKMEVTGLLRKREGVEIRV